MHKIRISGVSNVPCIIFVLLEINDVEIQFALASRHPSLLYVTNGVLYKLCDTKRLSGEALFMMLGSIKVHRSNVSPKIGFSNGTNKLYCEPLKSKSPQVF